VAQRQKKIFKRPSLGYFGSREIWPKIGWEQGDCPKTSYSREHWTGSREQWNQKMGASRISKVGAGRFGSEVAGSREIQTPPQRGPHLR